MKNKSFIKNHKTFIKDKSFFKRRVGVKLVFDIIEGKWVRKGEKKRGQGNFHS